MRARPLRRLIDRLFVAGLECLIRLAPENVRRFERRAYHKLQAFSEVWRSCSDDERRQFLAEVGLPAEAIDITLARQRARPGGRRRTRTRK